MDALLNASSNAAILASFAQLPVAVLASGCHCCRGGRGVCCSAFTCASISWNFSAMSCAIPIVTLLSSDRFSLLVDIDAWTLFASPSACLVDGSFRLSFTAVLINFL